MSHAGDTYDMGGGYYLYDSCGEDLLALGPDNKPIQDMERALKDIRAAAEAIISANGVLSRFVICTGGCVRSECD
jgi:hypothetical protein